MFTLAITCLTTSNLPWLMDLTFQVSLQYYSLQHRTLLLSPVTSTAGYCFCFGFIPYFFLKLFLHWSPVVYWAPTDLWISSFIILWFCLFILFMGFSRQESQRSYRASGANGSREEAPRARGQGWRLGGATPCPVSSGCVGAGGPRGAIPRWRSGRAAVRRYPSSKVRSSSCALLEQPWRDTPHLK